MLSYACPLLFFAFLMISVCFSYAFEMLFLSFSCRSRSPGRSQPHVRTTCVPCAYPVRTASAPTLDRSITGSCESSLARYFPMLSPCLSNVCALLFLFFPYACPTVSHAFPSMPFFCFASAFVIIF
jgi:hypothetical protein